jgi:hypothetical protein
MQPIGWRLGQAVELLRSSCTEESIIEGRWRLEEVHDLLGALTSEEQYPQFGSRVGRIRDSLAGHLAAGLDCAIARVRDEVIADVLCRGASMVRADLDALTV